MPCMRHAPSSALCTLLFCLAGLAEQPWPAAHMPTYFNHFDGFASSLQRHAPHALQHESACLQCRFNTEEAASEAHDLAAMCINGAVAETIYPDYRCGKSVACAVMFLLQPAFQPCSGAAFQLASGSR